MVGTYVNYSRVFAPVHNKQRGFKPSTNNCTVPTGAPLQNMPLDTGERKKKKASMYSEQRQETLSGTWPWFASCAEGPRSLSPAHAHHPCFQPATLLVEDAVGLGGAHSVSYWWKGGQRKLVVLKLLFSSLVITKEGGFSAFHIQRN